MSTFDHDAAAKRGVERQELIEAVEEDLLRFVEEHTQGDGSNAPLIALSMSLLKEIHGGIPFSSIIHLRLMDMDPQNKYLDDVCGRLHAFSRDMGEYYYLVLTLAKKLLETGTGYIATDLKMSDSQIYRR